MKTKTNKSQPIAGHRKKPFQIRNHQVPDAVHTIMELLYDMCMELEICPNCKLRKLFRKKVNGEVKVLSKCKPCLDWHSKYQRGRDNGMDKRSRTGKRP